MGNLTPLDEYIDYLNKLKVRLDRYFDQEKPYIACKLGCSACCKDNNLIISNLEFLFVEKGIEQLDKSRWKAIKKRAQKLGKEYKKFKKNNIKKNKGFTYQCPFLFDNTCTIYEHRPLLCRPFGLITRADCETGMAMPSCLQYGLNYANVANPVSCTFDKIKIAALGAPPPQIYDVNYATLIKDLECGEQKMIFQWILEKDK